MNENKEFFQILSKNKISREQAAEILKTTPEALEAFEAAYKKETLNDDPDSIFDMNSRQATKKYVNEDSSTAESEEICNRIVDELIAQTRRYVYDGKDCQAEDMLPDKLNHVTVKEVYALPKETRPQLTGNAANQDIASSEDLDNLILSTLYQANTAPDPALRKQAYNIFRQGLDLQDISPLMYEMLGMNPITMGHWLPKLVDASKFQDFFKIPKTIVARVPLTLLQMSRIDYFTLTPDTRRIADKWAMKAFDLDENKKYFIKTGVYSSKFDFRNAKVTDPKEIREIGEYLLFISHQASSFAGPLVIPIMYGAATTNEWVVREFIEDKENNPTIYEGLPLHTEYRVFIDCDTDEVLSIMPYWEPNAMKKRFGHSDDSNSPHKIHDYVIYLAHEETLMGRYYANKDKVAAHVQEMLPNLDLKGQWSLDIMQNGEDFWLIDMATAERSALYESVPAEKRRPIKENWIPQIAASGQHKEDAKN